jgi:tRNA (cmo5U34)-methyltransferase
MVSELVADFAADGTAIYDLGCSTGTTLLSVAQSLPAGVSPRFVGVDNSPAMLDVARSKLEEHDLGYPFELQNADLNDGVRITNASVVLLILTLQFVRPLHREDLMHQIYKGLCDKGCLILVEKVLGESSTFNRLFINKYYEHKRRQGYSELEIAQKREALENVLVPYRLEENRQLLRKVGFSEVDVFFKWYNFCAIVAMR